MASQDGQPASSSGTANPPEDGSLHPNSAVAGSKTTSELTRLPSNRSINEKRSTELDAPAVTVTRTKSVSFSSVGRRSLTELRESRRDVRTLPSWVLSYEPDEEDEDDDADAGAALLPNAPRDAQIAQHNFTPAPTGNKHPGRLYDSARERTPVMMKAPLRDHASRWRTFVDISAYAREEDSVRVDEQWLKEHGGDLDTPWKSVVEVEKTQRSIFKRIQIVLLKNAAIPLVLRAIVWIFSVIALGLSGSIYTLSKEYDYRQRPSTIMAIVLATLALGYVFAVTYDEYSGQPIGLRSAKSKMRLILLDLWFIIFGSANLSLAFNAISDPRWGCHDTLSVEGNLLSPRVDPLCHRQETLSGILLITLLAWVLTFTVSVFRVIEGLSRA